MISAKRRKRLFSGHTFLTGVVLLSVVILSYAILIQPWAFRPASPSVQIGDVAQQDLRAPKYLEYTSEIRTEEARSEAERAVDPVYAPPDATVARGQIEILKQTMEVISRVKKDPISNYGKKIADLLARS